MDEIREQLKEMYGGENKPITDGHYDPSLAVKCINGTFVGRKTENITVFRGIPYVGKQPMGDLRWKAPVDIVPNDGIYEAYYNAKSAYGNASFEVGSMYYWSEDCLYLNVFKSDDTTAKKPVMVWIHGGAFEAGGTIDPMFDCVNLLKEHPDIIVVTIAYRLGVMGFLHLSHLSDGADYPDAQNLGLLDQQKALKWVHENIAAFGGDPDNVTIWGESAGGASCSMQPLVPGSQQYFKRLIAESGSVNLTRTPEEGIACTNKLMEVLGCKTVADLLKVDGEKLLEASAVNFCHQFPERDGRILPVDTFAAYANGAAKDITILVGCNKDEMDFFVSSFGKEGWDNWVVARKQEKFAHLPADEKALVESYMRDVKGDYYEPDSRVFSQSWFIAPTIRISEEQSKAGGKCYTYYFTPESPDPIMKCGHAIELAVVFNHPEFTADTGRAFDETFCKTMRAMWVQFAKTGCPSLSAAESPDGKAKQWPLYDRKDKQVMVLDEFDIHPAKEADVKIVDWERTYFLTKYYTL
jgi:para-nitrobenzyl esterase